MKKQFINPAVRVIKYESAMLCGSDGLSRSLDPNYYGSDPTLAPTRHGVFGENSDF